MIQFLQIYFFLAVIYEVDPVANNSRVNNRLIDDFPESGGHLVAEICTRVNKQAAMFDTG
jgi:hypothetical protein